MTEVQSLKIINRYDSDVILHDSKDYPEFSGELWNDFVLFLVNKSANLESANLESANLVRANLYGANLYSANLESANLYSANLYGANLESANLYSANLYSANLYSANLYSANLESANLESANLESANLVRANLYGANLESANLESANLESANLVRANLVRTNLVCANLESANLESANLPLFSKWSIRYELPDTVHIGCKTKTIKEWDYWFKNSTEKFDHDRDSSTFKRISANYLGVRAYLKECQKQKLFKKEVDENNNIKWFAE